MSNNFLLHLSLYVVCIDFNGNNSLTVRETKLRQILGRDLSSMSLLSLKLTKNSNLHSSQRHQICNMCHKNRNFAGWRLWKFFLAIFWLSTIKQTRSARPFAVCALLLKGSSKGMALTRARRACQELIKYAWVSKCPARPMFANGRGFGQCVLQLIYRDHTVHETQYQVL